ncbi:MAG TPA: pitrilysin family protein [Pseudoflavonifractor sp.]|nr:pitrilysin family protein [Pseudoflavonifractor sp.]
MYEKITLPNGVRILTEYVPAIRSAAIGIWVGTGSRHETAGESGAAHFIEHMVFKGTAKRTAAQLAEEMDAVGGQINAFTTKENTCFYARVLDTHLPQATDILCDMFFSSRFDEGDVQTERGVILEEIGMYEDNPEDICSERLAAAVYKGSALGRPILGKRATLERMTGESLKTYMASHYLAGNLVVSLAGSFTDADVAELKSRFTAVPSGVCPLRKTAAYQSAVTVKKKATEQNHLTLAFPGLPYGHEGRFALQLLSAILGGGMSSRLWQEVREKRGLCYSVYSYGAGHAETGLFAVYTALGKDMEREALNTIAAVVKDFADRGVTQAELDRAREQSKANVLMGLESTQARMSNLGRSELLTGFVLEPDGIIAAYDTVTVEDVRRLAGAMFDFSRASLSAVGRVGTAEEYRAYLDGR